MASRVERPPFVIETRRITTTDALAWLVPVGRVLFAAIFVLSVPAHFTQQQIAFATSHGVPFAELLVPASGLLLLAGGLSIAAGYKARWGALALFAFLVPVTFVIHDFWTFPDEGERTIHRIMFMKNLAMTGATMLLGYFGAGPYSFDALSEGTKTTEPGR